MRQYTSGTSKVYWMQRSRERKHVADAAAPGDVMCPLGMHGQSKKLSDLLNEAKVPAADRATVPIVRTSPRGQVVWVAGIRLDERACCQPSSKLLLELSLMTDSRP